MSNDGRGGPVPPCLSLGGRRDVLAGVALTLGQQGVELGPAHRDLLVRIACRNRRSRRSRRSGRNGRRGRRSGCGLGSLLLLLALVDALLELLRRLAQG